MEQNSGPCICTGAARAPRTCPSLGCALPVGQVTQTRAPHGEELQLHHKLCAPSMLVSVLAVGMVCWLKAESWYPGFGGGCRRGLQGKPEQKAVSSVSSVTLKILGQGPPVRQFHLGTQCRKAPVLAEPAGGLLQTPLGGSCSPWSLSAALRTRAACECVRAGGMEEAAAVKGVF